MYQPKYALFYDNHTMPHCPDVGVGFDVENFVDKVKKCGVDYLTFHARCNLGMSYYDTAVGIKHPSLKYDLFGEIAKACKKKNIALTAYLNAGISSAESVEHPEWCRVSFDGKVYSDNRVDPYVRTMCFNSGYHEHLVSMVQEIVNKYEVVGFFLDCFGWPICTCNTCIKKMKKAGFDWTDKQEVRAFGKISALNLAKDIRQITKEKSDDLLFYFNGLGYEEQLNIGSYLECECLPTAPNWNYDFLPLAGRYMRTISDQPLLNMTARFYDWADFGGIRSVEAIKFELLTGLSLGLRPNIGSHIHPRADFEEPVFELVKTVYSDLQQYEKWYQDAKGFAEIAVLFINDNIHFSAKKYLKGATRMLTELNLQFDVISSNVSLDKYKLIILPDEITIDDDLSIKLKSFLEKGNSIIASGESGLTNDKKQFALEDKWKIKYKGKCQYDPAYIQLKKEFFPDIVDMPLSLYSDGIEMETSNKSTIKATIFKPYYNREWDGEYAFFYTPPDKNTDIPALVVDENIAQFSHKIFTGYHERGAVELRSILNSVIQNFLPKPIIKTDNFPSFARAVVTTQPKDKRVLVHLFAYVPELRGNTQIIEDAISLNNIKIGLRDKDNKIKKAYIANSKKELKLDKVENYQMVIIEKFTGYALLIFE